MSGKLQYIFVSMLVSVACTPLFSETRYVSKTGSNTPPYTTPETATTSIQAAVDEARRGDVILVAPGDYNESIMIPGDEITLIGAGRDCCRIIVPDVEGSVGVVADGWRPQLRGLAVLAGEVSISVRNDQDYVLIADCLLEGATEVGLSIGRREDVTVLDTLFENVPKGIYIDSGGETYPNVDLYVSGCQFVDTGTGIQGSDGCIIAATQCTFLRNGYGIYGGSGAVIFVDSCKFMEGCCGVSAMTVDGRIRVSDSVFAFNSWEALETDQKGLVTDCLFYANNRGCDEWDGGDQPNFLRCTFVSNQVALGRMPDVVRDCIFWNNGQDEPYWAESPVLRMKVVDHCFTNDSNFAGKNGNLSGNPGFVGWTGFNDTDNPMHVDNSAPPGGDGSAEHPFLSLQDSLRSFDFRLRDGSACVGAGATGGNIGYPAGVAAAGTPGSEKVAIHMAPRRYEAERLLIPPRITVCGAGDGSARPSLHAKEVLIGQGARISGLDFDDTIVEAREAEVSDCEFQGGGLCLYGASVVGSRVLGGRTYLAYGSPWGKIRNCVFAKSGEGTAVNLSYSGGLHEFLNCTIDSPDVAICLWDYYKAGLAKLTNCIIAGQVSGNSELLQADHCLFLEGWPGEGNIEGDPMFVDGEAGDFRLKQGSPCIDGGSLAAVLRPEVSVSGQEARLSWSPGEDLDGNPRISGAGVDMGVYEYQATPANFVVECSPDLVAWEQGGTTTGLEWIDAPPTEIERTFYRLYLSP